MNTSNHDYKGRIKKNFKKQEEDAQRASRKPKRDPPVTQLCSRHPQHTKKKLESLPLKHLFPKSKHQRKKTRFCFLSFFFATPEKKI